MCVAGMMIFSTVFMVKEILRRTKPEFVKIDDKKPEMPVYEKQEKKKKPKKVKKEDTDEDEDEDEEEDEDKEEE